MWSRTDQGMDSRISTHSSSLLPDWKAMLFLGCHGIRPQRPHSSHLFLSKAHCPRSWTWSPKMVPQNQFSLQGLEGLFAESGSNSQKLRSPSEVVAREAFSIPSDWGVWLAKLFSCYHNNSSAFEWKEHLYKLGSPLCKMRISDP